MMIHEIETGQTVVVTREGGISRVGEVVKVPCGYKKGGEPLAKVRMESAFRPGKFYHIFPGIDSLDAL